MKNIPLDIVSLLFNGWNDQRIDRYLRVAECVSKLRSNDSVLDVGFRSNMGGYVCVDVYTNGRMKSILAKKLLIDAGFDNVNNYSEPSDKYWLGDYLVLREGFNLEFYPLVWVNFFESCKSKI
jgi:hypothetical protein